MPRPHRIGPKFRTTSAESIISRGGRRELPEDLLRQASTRLGVVALLGAVLWVLGTGLSHVVDQAIALENRWDVLSVTDAIALFNVVVSLGLAAYARRGTGDPRHTLDLGLWYLGFTSLSLAMMAHWGPIPGRWPILPLISWNGVLVLIFAAIVPSTPLKTFLVGLVAVSMNPIAMLIGRARGVWHFESASDVLVMHYTDYILVGVSVLIAKVVTGLGQQVARARELGSYELGELIGRGGMGEVYRAKHRMLARPAAIKLIRPEMLSAAGEDPELVIRRFHREAEAAASLRSPHTVELYDFGVTEDRTLYFVMELLDGMDLELLVRQTGPVPAGRVIHILRQACESLEEAHSRGLVHRDIKPPNIHLGRLGLRHDFVKVLDFGLVKSVTEEPTEPSLATAAGGTPGTPAYMAPELALGEAYDGRADLYALGCVGYFLLTGRLVFEGVNGMQIVARHVRDEPVPPSKRTELPVPAELEATILACLRKRPGERPPSAAALGSRLESVPVAPWGEAEAARWWQAHRPA
jgi:tRNA A-37 threonylcarbamoyl transferase component Bud32